MAGKMLKKMLLATLLVVVSLMFAPPAGANGGTPPVITAEAVSIGAFSFNMKGVILEDVRVRGTRVNSPRCRRGVNGYNSGRDINGRLVWFPDTNMTVCPNRNSPTGWVKVAGGKTGRNCGNPVSFRRPRGRVVRHVTMIRSFAQLRVVVRTSASAHVKAHCPNNPGISGEAFASGTVRAVITQSMIAKAKGQARQVRVELRNELRAAGVAMAAARLTLNCGQGPPPPGVPPVKLIKHAFVDGHRVPTPSGFGFTVNGTAFSNTGEETFVGNFNVGSSVTICETNAMGWTPDKTCETQTVGITGAVFIFTNRRVTPPPPQAQPHVQAIPTQHVFSGGFVDLCARVWWDDHRFVSPASINWSPAEGEMVAGTKRNVGGDTFCQLWHAPETTIQHSVRWDVDAFGVSDHSFVTVVPDE